MSSDADAHKVGLIPVTLMVSGNIMGSGVFCYLQTGLHWRDCHLWMVGDDYRCAGALDGIRQNVVPRPKSGGSYAYARRCFGPFLGYQTNVLYWLACWIGNIAMVVIGVGYLLLLPDSERSIGINHHLRRGAVDLRPAEHCRSENDHPCAGRCHRAGADPHRRDCRIWLVLVPW